MHPLKWGTVFGIGAVALVGCATVPDSPSVRVMPAPGKPFEVFVSDDHVCRSYASQSISGKEEAANNAAIGSAVAGTAIGAAAGALIGGSGQGAGVGAGMGLIMGSAMGANQSGRSGYSLQRRYDIAYEQCMYAKGNLLPGQSIPYNPYARLPPPPPPPPPAAQSALPPPPPPPEGYPPPPPPPQ
jgi:hypothetical protein